MQSEMFQMFYIQHNSDHFSEYLDQTDLSLSCRIFSMLVLHIANIVNNRHSYLMHCVWYLHEQEQFSFVCLTSAILAFSTLACEQTFL